MPMGGFYFLLKTIEGDDWPRAAAHHCISRPLCSSLSALQARGGGLDDENPFAAVFICHTIDACRLQTEAVGLEPLRPGRRSSGRIWALEMVRQSRDVSSLSLLVNNSQVAGTIICKCVQWARGADPNGRDVPDTGQIRFACVSPRVS